jgi:conjugal transfer ATP-binding protein TraC
MSAYVYAKHLQRHTVSEWLTPLSYEPEQKLYFLKDGHIGFGFAFTPLPGANDSITQRLNVLLTQNFRPGTMIQVLLFASPDIQLALHAMTRDRKTENRALKAAAENRADLFGAASRRPVKPQIPSLVRQFRVIFTFKIPLGGALPSEEEIEEAHNLRISCEQILHSIGFAGRPLDPETFLRNGAAMLHWGESARWREKEERLYDPAVTLNEQFGEFDDFAQVDANGIWLGSKRLRFLSPVRLPAQMALQGMRHIFGDPMNASRGIHGNFFVAVNLSIPDGTSERMKAEAQRNRINYQAYGPMLKFVPRLAYKKSSSDILYEALEDGDRIVKMMITIGIYADDLDDSERRISEAQAYLREAGWNMREDRFIALPMLINSLPFGADPGAIRFLQRYKTLAARHAAEFLPVVGDWSGTGTPVLHFWSRAGQILPVDLFDSNTNYNCSIVAASGSGKSFLTNDIITSYIGCGARCWVIDIGRSYEKLCRAMGGAFIEFSEHSGICMNPFQIIHDYEEESDILVGIITAMAQMSDRLSDLQLARLRSVLRGLWDDKGARSTVDELAERLIRDDDRRVQDVGHQLFAFTSRGEYGRFFTGDNNVKFEADLVVLELEELKGRAHLQQVVLMTLIYQIQQNMYLGSRDQRKILIIDEAWDLLTKGNIASFIETGYRRFRKYGGAAITVTQSLNDLYGTPAGIAIAENSANLFMLYQKPETIESIKRQNRLMIGENGFEMLKTVHTVTGVYSEICFVTSYGIGIGRLVVDDYTRLLYSTHPDDVRRLMQRMSAGMAVEEAIADILHAG